MTLIYNLHKTSSPIGLGSDLWSLTVDEEIGEAVVVHAWSRIDAGFVHFMKGERSYSLVEFAAGNAPQAAKDALLARLAEIGLV